MSRSSAEACTSFLVGVSEGGDTTTTLSGTALKEEDFLEFAWTPVTVTKGLDLLAATHTFDAETTSGGSTATAAAASSSDKDSGATFCLSRVSAAMVVAGVALSIMLS